MTTAVLEEAAAQATTAPPLKVSDLKANAFLALKDRFTNHHDALEILNYINFLAQNNSVSADEVELPYPSTGAPVRWELDRAAATKLFFGHLEAKAAEIQKSIVLPDEKAQAEITKALKARAVSHKQNTIARIREIREEAESYMDSAQTSLHKARKIEEELEAFTEFPHEKRIEAILAALPALNWNFHKITGEKLEFVSRADIMLRHIEPKAGLNYELNCGKFRTVIHLSQMTPKVLPYQHCIPAEISPHIHPNVDCSGTHTAIEATVKGDIVALLRLLDALLPNYGSPPYVNIKDFKNHIDQRDKLERENYGKKEKEAEGFNLDQEILDDEPEFTDDNDWPEFNEEPDDE